MRKYQQLLLILVSVFCVIVLLFYRSENSRLKYVLQVVNFFGRNDVDTKLKIENTAKMLLAEHDFSSPLPSWQRIGSGFHVYSSFWFKYDFSPGGEVTILAIGLEKATVQFNCLLKYQNDTIIGGKFGFYRVPFNNIDTKIINNEKFVAYKFVCKITRDFGGSGSNGGNSAPYQVILKNIKTKHQYLLSLRNNNINKSTKHLITACVDLNIYNFTHHNNFFDKNNLIKFFIIHNLIGIDEFIVYNSNILDLELKTQLINNGIKINILPYNFPFSLENNYNINKEIIEIDCEFRNYNSAKYFLMLTPNEYFYSNNIINNKKSLLVSEMHELSQKNIKKFQIETYNICTNHTEKLFKYHLYNPLIKLNNFFIYKTKIKIDELSSSNANSIELKNNLAFVLRYVNDCNDIVTTKIIDKNNNNGPSMISDDGIGPLKDYRNLLSESFLKFVNLIQSKSYNDLVI